MIVIGEVQIVLKECHVVALDYIRENEPGRYYP